MPKESTLRSMVLCLSLVCLVCSALLGGVYVMTKGKIDQEQIKKTNNAIALVTPEFDNAPSSEKMTVEIDGKEVAVYPARKDGQAVGYAVESFTSKGFSGTIKRWNHHRLKMTHGVGPVHREVGSTGANSTPSRKIKGLKGPGHYGHERVTIQNLEIVKVDAARDVLLIRGAIPGPRGSLVTVKSTVKK